MNIRLTFSENTSQVAFETIHDLNSFEGVEISHHGDKLLVKTPDREGTKLHVFDVQPNESLKIEFDLN